ncbi:MAG: ABC transporter transmembrane domain-containing protein, partial [Pseudomonadota bacterium]
MNDQLAKGYAELRKARAESRGLYWAVGLFSFFANLLMLTGPLYMLQVYDRVLSSRSEATLVALSVLVIFLYAIMGVLDFTRGRIMGRVGARFQTRLDRRVFSAVLRRSALRPQAGPSTGLRDLEAVQRLMTSPALMALFDIPWTPIFLIGIWIFHPALGILALAGGVLLIAITVINQMLSRHSLNASNAAAMQAEHLSENLRSEAELLQSLGMQGAAFERWQSARKQSLEHSIASADVGGSFTSLSKTLRLILQSAMLGLGAYLVLQNQMTAGAMIAGSILLGRA